MMHARLDIGDIIGQLYVEPVWYILRTTRQAWAANFLARHEVEAWYPTETRHRERIVQGRKKREAYERPIVSGYVFAAFPGKPLWHEIKHRAAGKIIGVVMSNGQPRRFTDAELLDMSRVPERLREEKRRQEEAKRLRPGDEAMHPTFGRVTVEGVDGKLAKFIAPLFGGRKVTVGVGSLDKLA